MVTYPFPAIFIVLILPQGRYVAVEQAQCKDLRQQIPLLSDVV